jgi:hypothetical protein
MVVLLSARATADLPYSDCCTNKVFLQKCPRSGHFPLVASTHNLNCSESGRALSQPIKGKRRYKTWQQLAALRNFNPAHVRFGS